MAHYLKALVSTVDYLKAVDWALSFSQFTQMIYLMCYRSLQLLCMLTTLQCTIPILMYIK